jgi:hypothetical protein
LWTFRQRYPQLNLLPNIDFGALLIDSCSQGRNAIQSLVQMEKQCIRFEQASRNITIVPGSIFGKNLIEKLKKKNNFSIRLRGGK